MQVIVAVPVDEPAVTFSLIAFNLDADNPPRVSAACP
jgi:hypothetical protein